MHFRDRPETYDRDNRVLNAFDFSDKNAFCAYTRERERITRDLWMGAYVVVLRAEPSFCSSGCASSVKVRFICTNVVGLTLYVCILCVYTYSMRTIIRTS